MVLGQAYDVSLWAKVSPEMPTNCYSITYINSSRPATPVGTLNQSYKQFTVTYPASFFKQVTNTFTVVVRCDRAPAGGKVWVDDVTMTQVV